MLRPNDCTTARIALIAPWTAGIGSSLLTFASFALLAVEHGYTVVPHGQWPFAHGLLPPTHEHFFLPLSTCGAEAARRLDVTDSRFVPGKTMGSSTQHTEDFARLLREGHRTVRLVTMAVKRSAAVRFPFVIRSMNRTLGFAVAQGLTFNHVAAALVTRLTAPRPWLHGALPSAASCLRLMRNCDDPLPSNPALPARCAQHACSSSRRMRRWRRWTGRCTCAWRSSRATCASRCR